VCESEGGERERAEDDACANVGGVGGGSILTALSRVYRALLRGFKGSFDGV